MDNLNDFEKLLSDAEIVEMCEAMFEASEYEIEMHKEKQKRKEK